MTYVYRMCIRIELQLGHIVICDTAIRTCDINMPMIFVICDLVHVTF